MRTPKELVAYLGGVMFKRNLTDIAGGNISIRADDQIYISPRYAGRSHHWNLSPEDIVCGRIDSDDLLDNPRFSREGRSHLSIYRAFPEVNGIIHAHSPHVLPFCAINRPIEPVLRGTEKYGTLNYIPDTPPYSQEQADHIVEYFRGQEERMVSAAAAVLLPRHGLMVVGADIFDVLDALERINTNAWCIIAGKMLSDEHER